MLLLICCYQFQIKQGILTEKEHVNSIGVSRKREARHSWNVDAVHALTSRPSLAPSALR